MDTSLIVLLLCVILAELLLLRSIRKQRDALLRLTRRQKHEWLAAHELLDGLGKSLREQVAAGNSLAAVTEYLTELIGASAGALYLPDEDGQLAARAIAGRFPPLQPQAGGSPPKGKAPEHLALQERFEPGSGLIGRAARGGLALRIANGRADERIPAAAHALTPVENMLIVPLRLDYPEPRRRRVPAVFCAINKRGAAEFDAADQELLLALSPHVAALTLMVELYAEIDQRARQEQELRLARHFQQMLLPRELPRAPEIEFDGVSLSALEAGGDFYDFIWIDPEHLALVIADVAGKGIPGALSMSMARSVIRAQSPWVKSPLDMIREVNRRFLQDTADQVFITMIYAIIDFKNATLSFCRAGLDPPVSCSANGVLHVHNPPGIALGLMGAGLENLFEVREIGLHSGDLWLLHTDGMISAINGKEEVYGRERLNDFLQSHRGQPLPELQAQLLRDVRNFTGDARQRDDITWVLFKVHSVEAMKEQARVRSAPERGPAAPS